MVRHLFRLGAHTNLSFGAERESLRRPHGGIVERRLMNHRQADQASAEVRGIRARSSLSVKEESTRGSEHPSVYLIPAESPEGFSRAGL